MNNKERIINLIRKHEVLTKPQIAKLMNFSLPTVNKYVNELIYEKSLEIDTTTRRRTEGKPPIYYRLNRAFGKLLGVFFTRNNIIFLVTNVVGNIEKKTFKRIISTKNLTKEKICDIISKYMRENNLKKDIKFISIGIPGIIGKSGKILETTLTSKLKDQKLGEYLEEELEIPILVENDLNLVAKSLHNKKEYQNYDNLIYIHISNENKTVVGGSVIINNKLYTGMSSCVGEFSYLAVDSELIKSDKKLDFETMEEYFLEKLNKTSEEKIEFLSTLILRLIPTLNPEILFIDCKLITYEEIKLINSRIEKLISKAHLPFIKKIESKDLGLNGTITHALEFLYS